MNGQTRIRVNCPATVGRRGGSPVAAALMGVAFLAGVAFGGRAITQDEPWEKLLAEFLYRPEMLTFWSSVKELEGMSDDKGLLDLFRKEGRMGEDVFVNFEKGLMDTQRKEFLDCMKLCAKWLDEVRECKEYAKRIEYFTSLSRDDQYDRHEAILLAAEASNLLVGVFQTEEEPKPEDLSAINDKLVEAREKFEKLADSANLAWLYRDFARLYDKQKKFLEAVVAMDKAMDLWTAADMWKKRIDYTWLVERRRELIAAGYDPANPGAVERAQSAKNTASSFAAGSDWVNLDLAVRAEPKLERFRVPGWVGDNPYRWFYAFYRSADKLATFEAWFKPWGREVKLLRDSNKYFFDYDGDGKGDKQAKLKSKAELFEIPLDPADKNSPVYSFAMATGSNQETMFGVALSNLPIVEWTTIRYRGACYVEGNINGTPILILDDNDSGRFGDPYLNFEGLRFADGWVPDYAVYPLLDAMVIGHGTDVLPYSQYIRLEDGFYRIEPEMNAPKARYRKMDIDTGRVVLEFEGKAPVQSLVIGEKTEFLYGYFDLAKAPKEGLEVPVGFYEIASGLVSNGKTGVSNQSCLILKGRSKPFNVRKGETVTLQLGEPYEFDFRTREEGEDFVLEGRSLQVYGRGGELYIKFWDEAPMPKVSVRTKGGKVIARGESMAKPTYEEYKTSPDGVLKLFFPLDFRMPKKGKEPYEAQLELKKHKLLNAGITSPWK
ncbi:MAG: hypothetical protein AB1486_04300 [Planctomycetota bacterium]